MAEAVKPVAQKRTKKPKPSSHSTKPRVIFDNKGANETASIDFPAQAADKPEASDTNVAVTEDACVDVSDNLHTVKKNIETSEDVNPQEEDISEGTIVNVEHTDTAQSNSRQNSISHLENNDAAALLEDDRKNNVVLVSDTGGCEMQTSPKRPQTLPELSSVVNSLQNVSVSEHEQEIITPKQADHTSPTLSLAFYMQHHHPSSDQMQHHQTTGDTPSNPDSFRHVSSCPAVIEDPDTPMSRVASPPVSKPIKSDMRTPVPTIIQEEKSPTLLAQEALARSQALNINTTSSAQDKAVLSSANVKSQIKEPLGTHADSQMMKVDQELPNSAASKVKHNINVSERSSTDKEQTKAKQLHYPSLEEVSKLNTKSRIAPMTLNELLSLYYNPELAYNKTFVDEFVQKEVRKENHEFAEILLNYFRARHKFQSAEEDIRTLQKEYSALQKELWITHVKSITIQGQCSDQVKVSKAHSYEQCELNTDALSKLNTVLENIRKHIAETLSLHAYSAQISKLQVESYIYDLYMSCPVLRDIPKNADVKGRQQVLPDEQHQIQRLKDCISILFMFHRKPTSDTEFINNIRQWTTRLVSSLLRLATFRDHLFILNHVLRCPAGVGKWAAELVQFPLLSSSLPQHQSNFGGPVLDHIITAMATILSPTRAREEFMCHMRVNLSEQSMNEDKAWILVDSDGEEDEDPTNSWLYLHENDIVAFLAQLPLADIFSHVLLLSTTETGSIDYEIRRSTEPMMIHLFAFATTLIQLLGNGLATYNMARYRQLNKRLGRLIRQAVSFVSDHWLNFKTYYGPLASAASIEGLQMEFDQLFMRATYSILSAQKLGSWQFMADMPYTCVSVDSMWQLLWILHQGQGQVVNLDQLPPVNSCKEYMQDSNSWQQLADNLMHMPASEAIYLLTTFANMACSRSYEEESFICTVTLEVFEIAYICSHTREFCSKVGRELLSSIIQTHPNSLSFLLARVKEVMAKLGNMAVYLFSDLPLSIWQPSDPDMLILRQWLLNHDLSSVENQLARIILAKINWDVFEQTGRLVVDIRLHRQVALLLVEAYTRFISDKKAGFFIMEGMKQMASYIASSPSAEQVFNNWAWDLALHLKLHQQSVLLHAFGVVDVNFQPPTLGTETWLLPLLKGTSNKTPIACFVAVAMTNVGHDITSFIAEGLDMVSVLTSSYQYTTAIHLLGCVVPLFVDCPQYLLENVTFCQILQSLLVADESLFKSTKSAIMAVEFPGIVTQQLTEMIQVQVTSHLAQGKADAIITFWLKAIFKVCRFFTERNSCYVADVLIRWSFVKKGVLMLISDIFRDNYVKFCSAAKNKHGLVTSMFQWISSSNTLPSYMDSASLPEFPWLAYMILFVEGEMEVNTQLWQTLISELHLPSKPNVENALKAAVAKLQLEQAPTVGRLTVYRWAQQALDTPYDHPLLPILWQRFFALYLGRQVFESSIAQRASVGEKFFESVYYSGMLKRMRKRLLETVTFHMNFDPQKNATAKRRKSSHSPATPPGGDPSVGFEAAADSVFEDDNLEYTSSREFHQMLAKLYQMYSLWLEEPRLHDGNLYLPALPPQYEAARLNQVFQGFMGPWLEFVDLEGVQYTLSCLAADWRKRLTCSKTSSQKFARRNTQLEPENATERIMRRLTRFEKPKSPPAIQNIQSAVPPVSSAIVDDKESVIHLVTADLQVLTNFTKIFSAHSAHHCALDNAYIELVPELFSNETRTLSVTIECGSKVNPVHRCSGPAVIPFKLQIKQLNEIVQRRIDENRVEYKQVMIESLLPTAPNICVAAVHTENIITLLIKQSQRSTDEARVKKMNEIACHLFFYLAGLVSSETDFYPPTKLFLASCIEILGQQFVSHNPHETQHVLQLCLDKPSVAGLISPHFVPNACPQNLVFMYGQLLHVLQNQNMDLVFMLLTKFDIRSWLTSACPNEADRKRFVESLGSAMMACGAEPTSDCKLVFGLYLSHLAAVLESNFPSSLYIVINMVLQGSVSERLHTRVWETLLKSCFTQRALLCSDSTGRERSDTLFDPSEVETCVDSRLSTVQVKELLDWLSSFFLHVRMTDPQTMTFGLYSWWGRYVPYISLMMGALARSYVTKVINGTEDMPPYQIMALLWQPVVTVYHPWIQPLPTTDGSMVAPWVETDDILAVDVVSSFRKTVHFIYQQMTVKHPASSSGVLSLLLMYYMTGLSTKTTSSHTMAIYVSELKLLPWQELRPDLQLLETMVKMKEVTSPCCFTLIGRIMPQIQWHSLMSHFLVEGHAEVTARMQAGLAVLLIQTYVDPEFSQDTDICRLLSEALTFDWSMVTPEGYSCVSSWFIQLCDSKCVLAERSSNLALGLRLLKEIGGFKADVAWTEQISHKRLAYLHCITQQICQISYLPEVEQASVKTVIINLMSEVEVVVSTVPVVDLQEAEAVTLLKDILSLLNNSNPEGLWLDMIMSALTGWIRSSPQSLLLVPCMKATSQSLASLRQMSALMEVLIEVYFIGMDKTSEGLNGWPFILSVFQVPELNQAGYVQDSLSENAFLALYAYLQHKLPACSSLSDELVIMEEVLDWSTRAQANEEDEAKLILWWHLLLRLSIRQVQYQAKSLTGTINILSRFTNHLNQLAQDRTGKGFLGAIGLGRRSPLSVKMRVLTRSLSVFISCQILSTDLLRTSSSSSLVSSPGLTEFRTLRKSKSYSQFTQTIDRTINFIQDINHTILDVLLFLGQLTKDLYGQNQYLCDIVKLAE
ncbi:hypothetical protein BsWGS_11185 [Bradybaena similaris]